MILLLLAGFSFCHAQQSTLNGRVQDSLAQTLPSANILAFPQTENTKATFAIAHQEGQLHLIPYKDVRYPTRKSWIKSL